MAPKKGSASGKSNASKKTTLAVPDSDHIVFTKDKNDKRKQEQKEPDGAPPRVDVKKIIGGASWTGKLPVNLLSEHCQREKWNKPEYQGRQVPAANGGDKLYRSWVVLSRTDPKTGSVTKLPPFHLPPSHAQLADQPTALEARHFAAAYALFRVSSMKNLAMALPPTYRDLWKGDFQRLKEEDVKDGRAWKYDADPFAAELKGQEIKAALEKRKGQEARQPHQTASSGLTGSASDNIASKAWDRAPRLELGQEARTRTEAIIRSRSIWNPNKLEISKMDKDLIVSDLSRSGFQPSHIQEALENCGTREEVLEWLLIHVPEDCLPAWSFPPGYNAGITLVSSDLATEAKIKRLSQGGYPSQLCLQVLRDNDGDEALAAEALQSRLLPSQVDLVVDAEGSADVWDEEMTALDAILAERFKLSGHYRCSIQADPHSKISATFHFRRPTSGYPSRLPIVSIEAPEIPSHIRLSATKRVCQYAQEHLLGDPMIFSLLEWLESSMPNIIDNPGKLSDLEMNPVPMGGMFVATQNVTDEYSIPSRPRGKVYTKDNRTSEAIFDAWKTRQSLEAQRTMNSVRQRLPAWSKKEEVVHVVGQSQVTLITGETGSGKSTQAVQFVLDGAIEAMRGSSVNIICTQPRRVAALSLSERVSAERCDKEGQEVGYIIRGESKISSKTKITFQTTGVLLRRLQTSSNTKSALANVSHIFIDEVHERSLDTDFLLALLREALPSLPHLKIVLMSATLNADTFVDYFGGDRVGRIHVEGRTYSVQDYYLDDVVRLVGNEKREFQPESDDDPPVGKAIQNLGIGINYQLIASLVRHIDMQLGSSSGGILIFMPGTLEIDRCLRTLAGIPGIYGLPLHASLTPAEQRLVFRQSPAGKRKVVVATNVAETSITIEDIVAVVDSGKVKETNYDPVTNIVRLEEVWASRAACKQRRGRAGRVRAGNCYKLFTRNVEANMAESPAPEMLRTPLEQLCLSVKATGSARNVEEFLASTITPPDSRAVVTALKTLRRMGALENDRLTGLGTYLAMIPADLRCAKLLVYGVLFDCVESCLTIAAILATKSPFVSPREKRDEAKEARLSMNASDGDIVVDCRAYELWKEVSVTSRYKDVQQWCSSRFLSPQTLRDIDSTRRQLLDSLIEASLLPANYNSDQSLYNRQKSNNMLLRAIIAGALNPQIARIQMPDKKYIASMSGAKELDPDAKTIKYFNEENGRVFVHPSSVLFDAQGFSGNASFVSYFTKMATSKTFIRDLTPLNPYGLLLFGGPIEVDTVGRGVVVDGWVKLRGWARIGVLASRLRALLDDELRKRIDTPRHLAGDGAEDHDGIFEIVRHLVEFNGQDR
ncbi:hypothetical protein AYO21_03334 [Fonsecaea monophora]|uniref:Uncharacterized protein n=1 Tax=Fonsecaea monophora TaxID=254056 RepID=A0A177FE73_9EURO|nr:hypothetical protein AYO21_03334 [Fonsecaea monophora]KAH0842951.1 putative ATP-dependent RNA helicase ucp12 [Fonsecaea pedrosoi]OAG42458.1 hypothetical protein AYO21_03334 [Fonsecaea monophora]